ncbi:MAG: hypothetical protein VKK42_04850 [Lyngbya sp.]|nr:hypothetical protein [Lyngbya sp.]
MKISQFLMGGTMLLTLALAEPGFASEEKSSDCSRETESTTSSEEKVPVQYYPPPGHYPPYNPSEISGNGESDSSEE